MKDEKLKIWWITNIPNSPFEWVVANIAEAANLLNFLAEYNLHLGELVQSNAGGVLTFEGGEWVEWESETGECVDEWLASRKESTP